MESIKKYMMNRLDLDKGIIDDTSNYSVGRKPLDLVCVYMQQKKTKKKQSILDTRTLLPCFLIKFPLMVSSGGEKNTTTRRNFI